MPRRYAFGRAEEATHPDSMRATLAELLSTFIFVFVSEGSILALNKVPSSGLHGEHGHWTMNPHGYYKEHGFYGSTTWSTSGLIMVALATALALFAAVASSVNISGGHVNPAVTLAALVGGRISVILAVYYWVAQLLGAVIAALLLRLVTNYRPVGFFVASGVGDIHGLLIEIVLTFVLVYVMYATLFDPKRGNMGIIAPLAVGLIVGANTLVGGPFDGAAMNPARAFGPALVGWRWSSHWIYWIGPFIGAVLAALIYEYMVIPTEPPVHATHHQPLAPEDY